MKRHGEEEKENSERWLLTYSDLITLLLIFFIVMYTMSNVDKEKFKKVADALRGSLGATGDKVIEMFPDQQSMVSFNAGAADATEQVQMEEVKTEIDQMVMNTPLENNVDVTVQERGLVISIKTQILFESGKAELNPESIPLVEQIAVILTRVAKKQIRVEGHTDSDPIQTSEYPSNWELSSARATSVLKLILSKGHLQPDKISAVGYGEYRPKVPNTSARNKAKNRRVDILIIRDEFDTVDPKKLN